MIGNRRRGRLKTRWLDVAKKDLSSCGVTRTTRRTDRSGNNKKRRQTPPSDRNDNCQGEGERSVDSSCIIRNNNRKKVRKPSELRKTIINRASTLELGVTINLFLCAENFLNLSKCQQLLNFTSNKI